MLYKINTLLQASSQAVAQTTQTRTQRATEVQEGLRRSNRKRKPIKRYGYSLKYMLSTNAGEPET